MRSEATARDCGRSVSTARSIGVCMPASTAGWTRPARSVTSTSAEMADVVDLAAGAVVSRVARDPFSFSRASRRTGRRSWMADAPRSFLHFRHGAQACDVLFVDIVDSTARHWQRPRSCPPPREPVLRDRLPVRVTARRDRGEVRRRRRAGGVRRSAGSRGRRPAGDSRGACHAPRGHRPGALHASASRPVSSSSRTPSRRSRRARP